MAADDQNFFGEFVFRIDGVAFRSSMEGSSDDCFSIRKSAELIERTRRLCAELAPRSIFELGIADGGSVALLTMLARPDKLVAVEIDETPLPALARFIDQRDLGSSVRPYFGVDQADAARLTAIVEDEMGSAPLDLVIDDASHRLRPTRVSFDVLFPRLRPGGVFVIEDWNGLDRLVGAFETILADPEDPQRAALKANIEGQIAGGFVRDEPLSWLGVELMLARAVSGEVVEDLTIEAEWIVVRRGPAMLDPRTFRLEDHYRDPFGLLRA